MRTFIIDHLRFEDRIVIPVIRGWLPHDWSTGDAHLVEDWCQARGRRDGQRIRHALAAISRHIVNEEHVMLPLIEQHITIDMQLGLMEQSRIDASRNRVGSVSV